MTEISFQKLYMIHGTTEELEGYSDDNQEFKKSYEWHSVYELDENDLTAMHDENMNTDILANQSNDTDGRAIIDPHDSSVEEIDRIREELGRACKQEENEFSVVDFVDRKWK